MVSAAGAGLAASGTTVVSFFSHAAIRAAAANKQRYFFIFVELSW